MQEQERLVTVCRIQGEAAASIVKGRLDAEGIPAVLKYESLGLVLGVLVDGIGEVSIMVPQKYAEEARQIMEHPDPVPEDDDARPSV